MYFSSRSRRLRLRRFRPLQASSGGSRSHLHMGLQPCLTLCFPTAFVQDYTEAGYNQNVMTRAPGFARRRIA
ncbi:MAG: hypothetical protein Q8M95_00935 [Candidatus Methanoperedens sp.]|nr:hypothetical protein [Candidatus Methanoperedens sp.]